MSALCHSCAAPLGDGAKFCGSCGAPRAAGETVTARLAMGERRNMTTLFADLVGSTQLIDRHDAEDLIDGMAAYQTAIRQTVDRFGGFILHHLGDGVVVCFGYPVANEDAAECAVRAGLAIVEVVARLHHDVMLPHGIELNVRVGIATGVVVMQSNAATRRLEDNFTGAALNIAARLQSIAAPGEVVMAQSTARLVERVFVTRALGPQVLKGFAEPVEAFVVTDVDESRSRLERRLDIVQAPMIDRNDERGLLGRLLGEAMSGTARFVNLVGEAGIGKSRLAHVLREMPEAAACRHLGLQCKATLVNTVLHPHIDLLGRQCGIVAHDDDAARFAKLRRFLATSLVSDPDALALLASLLSIAGEDVPPVQMSPPAQRARTLATLQEILLWDARDAPMVIVYEDLHWIDPTSRELLESFVAASGGARLLLVATVRPGYPVAWADRDNVTTVNVARLTAADSARFAQAMGIDAGLSSADVQRIVARTDGVPLFVEEMTRMMLDAPDRANRAELPETLSDLLNERLDRLGSARRIMRVGAVIGREFSPALVAAVLEEPEGDLSDDVEAILRSGLVGPGEHSNSLMFKHALIQDAAYGAILARPRRDLHARVARCLTTDFAELGNREPELVARHLTQAGQPLEAAAWWLRAGGQAIGRGSAQEAAALLQAGLDALAGQSRDEALLRAELDLLAVLGPAQMVLKGPGNPDFGRVQRRAYDTCRALPDTPAIFRITYGLALFHWGKAELSTAMPLAEALDATARADPTVEHVMAANNMNGMIRLHLGDAAEARRRLTESVGLYTPERDAPLYPAYMMDFGVFGRFYLGIACAMTGDPEIAAGHARDAAALAEALGQPHSRGFSMLANFIVAMLREDVATARDWADRCVPFASAMGFPEFVGFANIALGWADIQDGAVDAGLERLEHGFAAWRATGFETWQVWFGALRMTALLRLGRAGEALAEGLAQEQRMAANGERLFAAHLARATAAAQQAV